MNRYNYEGSGMFQGYSEKELAMLCDFPVKAYTGFKRVKIGANRYRAPDFTFGDKVIEVFENYHKASDEYDFTQDYISIGMQCLVIWEDDIINKPDMVKCRVSKFLNTDKSR